MGLSWLLQSAYTIVLGCPKSSEVEGNHQGLVSKNLKVSKGDFLESHFPSDFQMPLHYPRYKKEDYVKMEEWRLDLLLQQYGMNFNGSLDEKRAFAMGAFLWPDDQL